MILSSANAMAQNAGDKKAKQAEQTMRIVNNQRFIFKANYVNPFRGGGPALTSEYDLFTKQPSRGFNTLTGLASLVRRPYSCHIICRCVCRLISVYHWK